MTTIRQVVVAMGLVLGLSAVPVAVWAAEHGGTAVGGSKEHGGAAAGTNKEHGWMAKEADEASLLREAAAALRKGETRLDLAAKLENLAKKK